MNIYKSMTKIMSEIGAIGKNQKNTMQGYKFRGIDDMLNALHPCLVKNEVFLVPRVIDEYHELKDVVRNKGNKGIDKHVYLKVEFDFVASDGSKITIGPITSEGIDSSDKATNKALSAALKYCLIQSFCIPTQDMDDADRDDIKISYSNTNASKETQKTPVSSAMTTISEPQAKRLFAISKECGYNHDLIKELLKEKYNIESSKNLTKKEYDEFIDYMQSNIIKDINF